MIDRGSRAAGDVVGPSDGRYPALSRGFNQRWLAHPDYVRLVSSPPDAADALTQAVSAQGGDPPDSGPMLSSVADYAAVPGAWEPRLMPWLTATQALDSSGQNRCGKYKSAYIRKPFTGPQLHALWESLHRDYAPYGTPKQALVQIDSYGSAINNPPRDTAERHRDSIMKMQYQAYWNRPSDSDPGDEAARLEWIRETYRATFAGTGGVPVTGEAADRVTDGCYINYPDTDLSDQLWNRSGEPWWQLYSKDAYPRLREVEKRWDPLNVFRHKQSVEP